MKFLFLLPVILVAISCTKNGVKTDEKPEPTAAEKRIIDAAMQFFKSDYNKIESAYRSALYPVLQVRKVLTEGACTTDYFANQCCCPFEFLLSPYDAVNGGNTTYNYPKTAIYTAKPGKMTGSFSATYPEKPVATSVTAVEFNNTGMFSYQVNGKVLVQDIVVSASSGNMLFRLQLINNSFQNGTLQINALSGNLDFSDAAVAGELSIQYADNTSIETKVTTATPTGASPFIKVMQHAFFTINGNKCEIDFSKQSISIGDKVFPFVI